VVPPILRNRARLSNRSPRTRTGNTPSRALTRHPAHSGTEIKLAGAVGSLSRCEQPAASYFRYFIRFPRPLDRGESHEVAVAVAIPGDQAFNPRYTHQPLHRCDEFDLRIRFGSRNLPAHVWNIVGLPRGMADDFADPDALVLPDAAGDIHLRYQHLRTGLAYGARWSFLHLRSVYPERLPLHPTAGAGAPACIHQRFAIVLAVPVHRPLLRLT
jgi:hypothetical protein